MHRRHCQDRLKAERQTKSFRFAAVALILFASLSGCGGRKPANPTELKGEINAFLWSPVNTAKAPALVILCATGAEPRFWDPLASAASREGYWVLVSEVSSVALQSRYTAAFLALKAVSADAERVSLVVDAKDAATALAALPTPSPSALIAFSPARGDIDRPLDDVIRAYQGPPLLLIACENDLDGANTAHALKDAAPGYCELQMYSCGVRGADILAAAPNVAPQILAWLKPITGEGLGTALPAAQ